MEEGRAVQHLAGIARQCVEPINIGSSKTDILKNARLMLEDSLVILAALGRKMANGTLTNGQKNAMRIVRDN